MAASDLLLDMFRVSRQKSRTVGWAIRRSFLFLNMEILSVCFLFREDVNIWNGQFEYVMLFEQMLAAGLRLDEYTVSSVLTACAF